MCWPEFASLRTGRPHCCKPVSSLTPVECSHITPTIPLLSARSFRTFSMTAANPVPQSASAPLLDAALVGFAEPWRR